MSKVLDWAHIDTSHTRTTRKATMLSLIDSVIQLFLMLLFLVMAAGIMALLA